jgi:transposase
MFVPGRGRKYDWDAIRSFYEQGHTPRECQALFGFSNGAWHCAVGRGDIALRGEPKWRRRGATRRAVAHLLEQGLTQAKIAKALGVSRATVCFHVRQLGIDARPELARRFDWVEIRAFYAAGHSMRECMRRFGCGRNAWAEAIRRGAIVPRPKPDPIDLVLIAGRRRNRHHLKNRLLLEGLKEARCEMCGLSEWRDMPIALELHHSNGDGLDNRPENLLLLCPNCHSQTDTWGGRNKGRRARAA